MPSIRPLFVVAGVGSGTGDISQSYSYVPVVGMLTSLSYREAMSTIWRTWTQCSGLYTNDNEVLTHLSRRFKLEVDNRRWFDSSWIEQRVNRRWKNSTALQVA